MRLRCCERHWSAPRRIIIREAHRQRIAVRIRTRQRKRYRRIVRVRTAVDDNRSGRGLINVADVNGKVLYPSQACGISHLRLDGVTILRLVVKDRIRDQLVAGDLEQRIVRSACCQTVRQRPAFIIRSRQRSDCCACRTVLWYACIR
ncbi:hypothetical protein D3C84_947460 [compost metagenome]